MATHLIPSDAFFVEDVSLVNKELSVPLLDVICSSLVICSALCVRTAGCFGFSFREATGTCRLHDSFVTAKTVLGNRVWKAVHCYQAEPRPGVYCLPSCYCIMPFDLYKTWDDANLYCADEEGSYLAKVDTRDRLNFILSVMRKQGLSSLWSGGHKNTPDHSWQWVDGTLIDTGLMNIDNTGTCLYIWEYATTTLDDAYWNDLIHFVCQKGTI